MMNTYHKGNYTEKELQSEKGPFQLELTDDTYQYFDPVTNKNGKGNYEILDGGVIYFKSGNLEGSIAISKKKVMHNSSLTLYDLSTEKKLELIKYK